MKANLCRVASVVMLLLFQGAWYAFSQQVSIKGKIVDEKTSEALGFANVALMRPDSSFVKGEASGEEGEFTLSAVDPGDYLLSVSFIGYDNSAIKLSNLSASIDLGEVYLRPAAQLLDEVVVGASGRISRVDRQVILPAAIHVKSSGSGFELLNSLMIPGLRVDPIQNTVSAAGNGNVQMRINHIPASATQIKALRPSNVLRVEHIDNPGVRYGDDNVSVVIDFIVRPPESGMSLTVDLQNAPLVGFANDLISFRANHKLSEFGLDYFMNYRSYKKRYSDDEEKYVFPSEEIRREKQGLERAFGYTDHSLEASYNLTQADRYVFQAVFRDFTHSLPNNDFAHRIRYSNGTLPDAISQLHVDETSHSPSLDLYYQSQLPRRQSVTLNVVGTVISTDYERSYGETQLLPESGASSMYAYSTEGRKYSAIGEGLYEKEFAPFKLTSGLRYTQSYTENRYTGSTSAVTRLHNSSLYAFAQLQGALKGINYQVGAGLSHSSFRESAGEYSFLTFRPSLSLSYSFLKASFLRYRFSVTPLLPSLSALSNVRQVLDDFRVRDGNPNLKPYRRYQNSLLYRYSHNLFSGTFTGTYDYYRNPIMEDVFREDAPEGSTFVYTRNNQKSFRRSGAVVYLSFGPVKDIVSVMVEGGVNRYFSEGNHYSHRYTNWYIGAGVQASWRNWIFFTGVNTRENSFYGETISMGEALNNIGLYYTVKNCRLGLSMLYPYSDAWKAGSENISALAYSRSWTYIRENGRMLMLNLSWAVNYGKKHQPGKKTLNNSDMDSGIVK